MTRKSHTLLGALSVAFLLAGASNLSLAASACKGLEQAACGAKASCSWVEGYTRSDGRKVSSYCRTKSGAKKVKANPSTGAPEGSRMASQ